jgi:uncharacterized protein (UPF0332 family)
VIWSSWVIWGSYVVLADELAGLEFEAARRSAVSRAYYGAFNLARRWLETHVMPIDDHRAHGQVWRAFRVAERAASGTGEEWQLVGDLGTGLRALRNQADYADAIPGLDREAVDAVATAELILQLLAQLEVDD